ncbi:MAG: hypothetical protein PHE67_04650 [Campylobacterales bacterium]|nr:hypothetical protein [Campylobacterales bacterium]
MSKIYCTINTKGGVGKSTISFQILPIILGGANVVEIDDNNDTAAVLENDAYILSKKSVRLDELDATISSIIFQSATKDTPIVVDSGGGNDTRAVIQSLVEMQKTDVCFVIPLKSSRAEVQNALDTYALVKDLTNNIVFIKNGANEKDFIFWDGSKEFGLEPQKPKKSTDVFLPSTPLFDIANSKNETLASLAEMSGDIKVDDLIGMSGGDEEKFLALSAKYRNSVKAADYIAKHIVPLKKFFS